MKLSSSATLCAVAFALCMVIVSISGERLSRPRDETRSTSRRPTSELTPAWSSDDNANHDKKSDCKLLQSLPKREETDLDKIKVIATPKNRAAIKFAARMVFQSGLIAEIEPTSVDYENTRHWEILKIKSPCLDVDLLFTNSSVFKALSFGHVEVKNYYGPLAREKLCMFHTPSEDKRSRFKQGLECLRERNYNCEDDYGESKRPVAVFRMRVLRVEFGRNQTSAPRDDFESPVRDFVKCLSREEVEAKKRRVEEWRKSQSTTSGPLVSSFGRSTTTNKPLKKIPSIELDEESGIESSEELETPPRRSSSASRQSKPGVAIASS